MKRSAFSDPYQIAIERMNQKGVRYVVVGMAGINYYAEDPSQTFGTLDYDIFLEPSLTNVRKAVQTMQDLGFTLWTATGRLQPGNLKHVVRHRQTITATTPDGLMIELLLEISGYPFSKIARDAATFTVGGIPIRVGKLKKLMDSKRLSDRPKDRQFLKRYEILLKNAEKRPPSKKSRA